MLSVGFIFAMLSLVFTQLIANKLKSKIRSQAKKVRIFSLNSIIYLLLFVGLLTLPVLLTLIPNMSLVWKYTIIAIYALLIGTLHIWAFYKQVKWAEKGVDILPDILFAFILVLLGTVTFIAALNFLNDPYIEPTKFIFVLLPFVLPMFILKTIFLLQKVPKLDYPKYKISKGEKRVSPEERRNSRLIGVTLMMPMGESDEELTPIECRLLSDIEFGINVFQLFRQYNTRPDLPSISTHDSNGNEYEYLFYFKPKWIGRKKFIEPEINVVRNKISNKDVIILQRHSSEIADTQLVNA